MLADCDDCLEKSSRYVLERRKRDNFMRKSRSETNERSFSERPWERSSGQCLRPQRPCGGEFLQPRTVGLTTPSFEISNADVTMLKVAPPSSQRPNNRPHVYNRLPLLTSTSYSLSTSQESWKRSNSNVNTPGRAFARRFASFNRN